MLCGIRSLNLSRGDCVLQSLVCARELQSDFPVDALHPCELVAAMEECSLSSEVVEAVAAKLLEPKYVQCACMTLGGKVCAVHFADHGQICAAP